MADQFELRFTHLVLNALLYWVLFVAEANEWWQKAQGDVKRTLDFPFKNQQRAKNVIFFLGDGMGQNTVPYIFCWPHWFSNTSMLQSYSMDSSICLNDEQLSAARALKAHDKGKWAGEEALFVDSFIHTGYSKVRQKYTYCKYLMWCSVDCRSHNRQIPSSSILMNRSLRKLYNSGLWAFARRRIMQTSKCQILLELRPRTSAEWRPTMERSA